ncbi:hypothetical protein L6164_016782 [Bauhinia variegata]|uniref:Uncharacterized protein n=1 Tax=Bauhinia variegata TaxID=167791 RepID=A0ACB9N5I2_BAUVA|nr:hypothetical protein L6164_016782 [Bauhinia variegata]
MALSQFLLFPNSGHSKILQPVQIKPPSLLKTNVSYVRHPIQCMAIYRRSGNFEPSIWHYDYIQSLTTEFAVRFLFYITLMLK